MELINEELMLLVGAIRTEIARTGRMLADTHSDSLRLDMDNYRISLEHLSDKLSTEREERSKHLDDDGIPF